MMIIQRDWHLANNHSQEPASCNDHLSPPRYPSHLCEDPDSILQTFLEQFVLASLLWMRIQMVVMQASIQQIRYFSVTIPCVTRRSMHGKGRWSSRLRRRRAPSRGCTQGWTWAKSAISSTWLIVITSGISPGASSFGLSFGPLWEEKRQNWIQMYFKVFLLFNQLRSKT